MTQDMSPTRVRVGLKFVRNLGNYENIHVDVGVEDNVRQGENVSQAMDRVYEFVEEQLIQRVQEIEADLSGSK
jgi:hypothetical protein